jgi:hypothetical protein
MIRTDRARLSIALELCTNLVLGLFGLLFDSTQPEETGSRHLQTAAQRQLVRIALHTVTS